MKVHLIILLIIIAILYGSFLDEVPVHLNQDELGFSLNAYSIAKTGFDENGRFFPLYFWHLRVMYSTPIIVYLTALFLTVFPLSEMTIRLPSVVLGLINIILVFFLAKKLFHSEKFGLLAAGLLVLTPVHFIQSRILLDNLFIVPFVLGWLLLLLHFLETKSLKFLFFAVFLLGFGVHSYHAAKIMMPIYFLLTLVIILPEIIKKKFIILVVTSAFILPLLPLIPWLSQYPDTLTDQVRYTGLYDTRLGPLQGIATLLMPEIITQRLVIYFKYFDPKFLFLTGDISLIHSTQKAGVFLIPFAILLPLGIYQLFKKRAAFNLLLIACFFISPIAPALVGNEYRVSKELVILPFAALIATFGIRFLLNLRLKVWRWVVSLLLTAIPLQFIYFANGYFTNYPARSYAWFNYNIPGALEEVIKQDKNKNFNRIYLDNQVYFIDRYWRFFTVKHNKEKLLLKTDYIDPTNINSLPNNSLLLARFDHLTSLSMLQEVPSIILEPDGTASFYIYHN